MTELTLGQLRARRLLCRRLGAAITAAMAETDNSFESIAAKLEWGPGVVRSAVLMLMNGRDISLGRIADITWAMGIELRMTLVPKPQHTGDNT